MFYNLIEEYEARFNYSLSKEALDHLEKIGNRIEQKIGKNYKSPTGTET